MLKQRLSPKPYKVHAKILFYVGRNILQNMVMEKTDGSIFIFTNLM